MTPLTPLQQESLAGASSSDWTNVIIPGPETFQPGTQVTRGEGGEPEQLDPELLTPQLVADVALRCCFVTSLNRGRQLTELASDPAEAKEGLAAWLSKDAAPTIVVPCGGDKLLQVD